MPMNGTKTATPQAPPEDQDRGAFLEAMRHPERGCCGSGNWKRYEQDSRGASTADFVAYCRATCQAPYSHPLAIQADLDTARAAVLALPPCGWWWCAEVQARPVRWGELLEAVRILQRKDIDPSGYEVVNLAAGYARLERFKAMWSAYRPLRELSVREAQVYLCNAHWAAEPRRNGGNRNKPMQVFLNNVHAAGYSAATAAAIFVLFHFDVATLAQVRRRFEVNWVAPSPFNCRQRQSPTTQV
jgi:hypothetical protein